MTAAPVPIKFVIGSRKIFAVPRLLENRAYGLDDLLSSTAPAWPVPNSDAQGIRMLSAPTAQFEAICASFPDHLVGGFQSYERYYIEMAGKTYPQYLAQFSSKTRSTIMRKCRKLRELSGGRLDIREFHRESDVEAFMADAWALSRLTYQARLLDAGLPEGPDAVAAMKALARNDEVRAYILYLDDRPISYLYLPTTSGIVTYAYLGYHPDHAHLSAGTVLQMEVLERLFSEARYRYFDFTEGEGAHKKLFGTASVAACSFFLLRSSAANRVLISGLNMFDGTIAMARNVAERSGALARVRKLLRD